MAKRCWGLSALFLLACEFDIQPLPTAPEAQGQAPAGSAGKPARPDAALPGSAPVGGTGNDIGRRQEDLPGPVVTAARAPKPVSGGTLLVLHDEKLAVVSDPDRDQLFVVDLEQAAVARTLALEPGSEPGRAAQDAEGHVHVALRGSGRLLSFDPASGEVLGSRAVCAYPRGVAVGPHEAQILVACAEGQLVSLSTDARMSEPAGQVQLARDLRDVVVSGDSVWVSRFRSAEVLRLDAEGKLLQTITLPSMHRPLGESAASVAWRMIPSATGGVIVVHQRAFAGEVVPSAGGYGKSEVPGGIVTAGVSVVDEDGTATGSDTPIEAPLPVDVAESPVTGRLLLASATVEHPTDPAPFARRLLFDRAGVGLSPRLEGTPGPELAEAVTIEERGQIVAVGFAGDVPLLQLREPSQLRVGERVVDLPGESLEDTGSTLFHLQTLSGITCASCHPEGHEDGHVWNFEGFGPRRTQSLRGGLLGSEPFHWDGQERDFVALTSDVMQGRMTGPKLTQEQNDALAHYLDALPALPARPAELSHAAARGKVLFEDAQVGCATCHGGPRFSRDWTVFVGGDAPLQVPSLIGVWARAPYMHDGCATTLLDRFTRCDSGEHGNLKGLGGDDLNAIVAYLETL